MVGRFSRFTLISGVGWLLDLAITLWLTDADLPLFVANGLGAFCAVTFVFVAATRNVFRVVPHRRMSVLIGAYWGWQLVAILAASALVAALGGLLIPWMEALATQRATLLAALGAKVVVTPLTLVANFLFMQWLLERPRKRVA